MGCGFSAIKNKIGRGNDFFRDYFLIEQLIFARLFRDTKISEFFAVKLLMEQLIFAPLFESQNALATNLDVVISVPDKGPVFASENRVSLPDLRFNYCHRQLRGGTSFHGSGQSLAQKN